ncbi:MAG: hypothetical protein NTY74_14475 [Ignavibacteriae bacterium]|nr:hypothetical protein [Ignavibacteriota bacterium]
MRKLFLLMLLFVLTKTVFSQAEFKISIEGYEWSASSSSLNAELQINIKIKNVGNKAGQCNDFEGIWLYSSSSIANDKITFKRNGTYLFKSIKPNDYITSFLIFSVPKEADDLELRFTREYGGAGKYITGSYNKYFSQKTDSKVGTLKAEADALYASKSYDKAIVKYILCTKYDLATKSDMDINIANCYTKIADTYYDKFLILNDFSYINNAIDNYRVSLEYNKDTAVSIAMASLYERIGNNGFDNGKYQEALTNYEKSLKYNDQQSVRDKIDLIKKFKVSRNTSKNLKKTESNVKSGTKSVKAQPKK